MGQNSQNDENQQIKPTFPLLAKVYPCEPNFGQSRSRKLNNLKKKIKKNILYQNTESGH